MLLLLVFGVMQVASLLWLQVRLQHAAHCAARAYTVWRVEDETLARTKAQAAAWLALRPQAHGLRLQVSPLAGPAPDSSGGRPHPEVLCLELQALVPAFPGFKLWREDFLLHAQACILSETPFGQEPSSPEP